MPTRISIDGNLVADPEFGVGDSGASWAHLRVASHERVRRDGEWVSTDPEFYNITLFGPAAENAANELHKGDRVTVQGRPQLETFDRRDGTPGAAVKVYARTITRTPTPDHDGQVIGRDPHHVPAPPVIHHTPDSTSVVGVARTATAMHKTLKDHGFRWSARTTSWTLPADMDHGTRTDKVNELLTALREHGRELTVRNDPAPTPTPAATATAAIASPGAAPAPITVIRGGRDL